MIYCSYNTATNGVTPQGHPSLSFSNGNRHNDTCTMHRTGRTFGTYANSTGCLEWNQYRIECRGSMVKVILNGESILDVNLDEQQASVQRHDATGALPLRDRPRRGHIGFQELSRDGSHVAIRHVRILSLD